jgi:hypothetical protein
MSEHRLPSADDLRALFRYEPDTGRLFWRRRPDAPAQWNTRNAGRRAGCVVNGRRRIAIGGKIFMDYRIIWKMLHGEEPEVVDHIDGNPRNNRLSNLRAATRRQNSQNARGFGSSGFKGVSYIRARKRWVAQICVNGRSICLGSFRCPLDAHAAYVRAAKKYFGVFARTT